MLFIGLVATVAVLVSLGVLFLSGGGTPKTGADRETIFRDINFAVTVPEGWVKDEDTRKSINANVTAMRKGDTSARIAIAFTGFKTRNPQPGELREGLISERLNNMFDVLDPDPGEGTWLHHKSVRITFRGRGAKAEGNFTGEGYAVGVHGNAYWFLAWCLESDYEKYRPEFEQIRNSCRLLDPNQLWTASNTGTATIMGEAANYRLTDGDQWWTKGDPTSEDAKADLVLKAKFKSRGDRPPEALAVVYLLPGTDDPLGVLRKHVKDRYAKLFDIKRWSDITGEPQGDPPGAGMNIKADVPRYHAESDQGVSKLVVLHAISTPKGTVGIEASCAWNERSKWERRLIALCASLQPK